MKAVSDGLFFTTKYHDRILKQCVEHLTELVLSNELSHKLKHFRGNSYLFKDYCDNPSLPGFENINLELISLIYKTQIKVYSVNMDDLTLNATIVNNNYKSKIELFKNTYGDRYETLYPIENIKNIAFSQNILFNMLNGVLNNDQVYRNINNGIFINIEYENWIKKMSIKKKITGGDDQRFLRPRHKKSLSDTVNKVSNEMDFSSQSKSKEPFDIFGTNKSEI